MHAWLNPYRANLSPNKNGLTANHMCNVYSTYCYAYGNYMWMDPAADVAVDRLVDVINDILTRYDLPGRYSTLNIAICNIGTQLFVRTQIKFLLFHLGQ